MIHTAGFFDCVIRFRFLIHKLIAGETEYNQTLILVLLVKILQAIKLWCEAAFGCGIYDEDCFSFKVTHFDGCAIGFGNFEVIKIHFRHIFDFDNTNKN